MRTDRDGDLVMGAAPRAALQPARGGRGGREASHPTRQSPGPVASDSRRGGGHTASLRREQLLGALQRGDLRSAGSGKDTTSRNGSVRITGWNKSNSSTNSDGGLSALISWLERRVNISIKKRTAPRKTAPPRTFKLAPNKYHLDGDALIISASSADQSHLLHLNDFEFAGVKIKVEAISAEGEQGTNEGNQTREMLQSFLHRRYDPSSKLLDLSTIGQDQEIASTGMFTRSSTQSKFIPALMKVAEGLFKSSQEKKDTVQSITLSNNSLDSLSAVKELAPTFPDLLNLDLSNNNFASLDSLSAWKNKFKHLDQLIVSGNPLEQNDPKYAEELAVWFPTLRVLNNIQIRTEEQIVRKQQATMPILAPRFEDESGIGENFIKSFFPAFDSDRNALAQHFYDSQSNFSVAINMGAPRDAAQQGFRQVQNWDRYLKQSRNLKKYTHLNARMNRLLTGSDDILKFWQSLPITRHPSLESEPQKWLIESHTIPGIPDPTSAAPQGVDGLIITVHGEYEELDGPAGQPRTQRGFDRTFILGPGGAAGVRVVSDMLTLRAYGGHSAFVPTNANPEPTQAAPIPTQPVSAQPAPTLSNEQTQMLTELARQTGMNLQYSKDCLDQSQWNFQLALETFTAVQPNLGPEAYAQ
ncbi:MAG: nuclear mRNA export, poly(A)+RNA binding protein [Bathelium mastoideum]|nr:MAG: nuclear mRNA export, poly(A)+RNA binding protein [Bathelium mastoideum]